MGVGGGGAVVRRVEGHCIFKMQGGGVVKYA